jgi:hypothetical protein
MTVADWNNNFFGADRMEHNSIRDSPYSTSNLFCQQHYQQCLASVVDPESRDGYKNYGGDACKWSKLYLSNSGCLPGAEGTYDI